MARALSLAWRWLLYFPLCPHLSEREKEPAITLGSLLAKIPTNPPPPSWRHHLYPINSKRPHSQTLWLCVLGHQQINLAGDCEVLTDWQLTWITPCSQVSSMNQSEEPKAVFRFYGVFRSFSSHVESPCGFLPFVLGLMWLTWLPLFSPSFLVYFSSPSTLYSFSTQSTKATCYSSRRRCWDLGWGCKSIWVWS